MAARAARSEIDEIRRITERNARGVKETRAGTADLLRHARTLSGIVDGTGPAPRGANGRGRERTGIDRIAAQRARRIVAADRHPHRRCRACASGPGSAWLEAATRHRPPRTQRPARWSTSCRTSRPAACSPASRRSLETGAAQVLAPAFHHYLIPCPPAAPSPHFDSHAAARDARRAARRRPHRRRDGHDRRRHRRGSMREHALAAALRSADPTSARGGRRAAGGRPRPARAPRRSPTALRDDDWQVRRSAVQALATPRVTRSARLAARRRCATSTAISTCSAARCSC